MNLATARRWFTVYRNTWCVFNGWSTRQQMEALADVEEQVPQTIVAVYQGRSPMRLIYRTHETHGYFTSIHLKGH